MSIAARAHVQNNFTMRQVNERMRIFYAEAVAQHRAAK
jgi:hypothetical protein